MTTEREEKAHAWAIDHENNRILGADLGGKHGREVICSMGGNVKNPDVLAWAEMIVAAPALTARVAALEAALARIALADEMPGHAHYMHKAAICKSARAALRENGGST